MYEKIKAEIERYIAHYKKIDRNDFNNGEMYICQELLSFIESLEKEKDVDLEKEIEEVAMGVSGCDFCHESEMIEREEWCKKQFRHFYELGLNAKTDTPKIKGWVARDKDGQLGVYDIPPVRGNICWYPQVRFENWVLPENAFPNLKWEDEPIEVELEIHRV